MRNIVATTVGLVVLFGAQQAWAKNGFQTPSFLDNANMTLTASGQIKGAGNSTGGNVTMTATAQPVVVCINGNQTQIGKKPKTQTVPSPAVPVTADSNGNISYQVTTTPLATTTVAGAPDCPAGNQNGQWTEQITDFAFVSAGLVFKDPTDTAKFALTCTFNPPTTTSTNPVPASTYSCK